MTVRPGTHVVVVVVVVPPSSAVSAPRPTRPAPAARLAPVEPLLELLGLVRVRLHPSLVLRPPMPPTHRLEAPGIAPCSAGDRSRRVLLAPLPLLLLLLLLLLLHLPLPLFLFRAACPLRRPLPSSSSSSATPPPPTLRRSARFWTSRRSRPSLALVSSAPVAAPPPGAGARCGALLPLLPLVLLFHRATVPCTTASCCWLPLLVGARRRRTAPGRWTPGRPAARPRHSPSPRTARRPPRRRRRRRRGRCRSGGQGV